MYIWRHILQGGREGKVLREGGPLIVLVVEVVIGICWVVQVVNIQQSQVDLSLRGWSVISRYFGNVLSLDLMMSS